MGSNPTLPAILFKKIYMISSQSIEAIKEEYKADIARLKRMLRNMHSVSDIRFIYSYLSSLEVEVTHEFIMLSEALTTSLVVGYGRLFTQADGTTKLNADSIPKDLRPIHDEIMRLRHERYAHHGAHNSVKTKIDIKFDDTSIVVNSHLELKMCLGAPKEWGPLFEWIDRFMYETSKEQLDYLTEKSGVEWKMPDGPAPAWISNKDT